jgi:hypothetical protein
MDWTKLHRRENVRCPYCAEGLDFRLMARQASGDWYLCEGCGHVSLPSSPLYRCICGKCSTLNRKWGSGATFPVIAKRRLLADFHLRLRHFSRLFRRTDAHVP